MPKARKLRLMLLLTLTFPIFLSACAGQDQTASDYARVNNPPPCTPMPKAGPAVADELQKHCFPVTDDSHQVMNMCPAVGRYLAQLEKFKTKLDIDAKAGRCKAP